MTKCLIVDDVEVSRFTSEQILASLGIESAAVSTIEEAIQTLTSGSFDLVLLDWHLRKVCGLDLIEQIKGLSGHRPRIIVFSGVENPDNQSQAITAGADAFLEKPTTKEKLDACLKNMGFSHKANR